MTRVFQRRDSRPDRACTRTVATPLSETWTPRGFVMRCASDRLYFPIPPCRVQTLLARPWYARGSTACAVRRGLTAKPYCRGEKRWPSCPTSSPTPASPCLWPPSSRGLSSGRGCRCTCAGSSTRSPTKAADARATAAPTSRRASGGPSRARSPLLGELKVMVPEIMLLVALREHNRKLWTRSFPFHFGLYLVGAATAWMILAGILATVFPGFAPGLALVTRIAIPIVGGLGLILGLVGAIGLFLRRRGRELRDYTAPADLFNLVFFVIAFGCALATFALVRPRLLDRLRLRRQSGHVPAGRAARAGNGAPVAGPVGDSPRRAGRLHSADPHVALRRQVLRLSLDPLAGRPQPARGAAGSG